MVPSLWIGKIMQELKINMNSNLLAMQHDPQKFRKPDSKPFTIFWFSSTLSPAAQSGLACNCHWGWSPVLLKLLTCCNNNNNNIFHHLRRRHWPLRASGVIGVIAWPDHGQVARGGEGGADQGFVRREMSNFFGFDRNYLRLQYCRAFFRGGVWFFPEKQLGAFLAQIVTNIYAKYQENPWSRFREISYTN